MNNEQVSGELRTVILPVATGLADHYWKGIARGELLLQQCIRCGHQWHPVADVCGRCQSMDFKWRASTGRGIVYSYTIVHHAVHPIVASWIPYTIVLVTLEEGPRLLSSIEPDLGQDLDIGEQVELTFREAVNGFRLPVFKRLVPNG